MKQDIYDLKFQRGIQSLQSPPASKYTTLSVQENGGPKVKEEILLRGSAMVPVNMIKNPYKEQLGWKNVLGSKATDDKDFQGDRNERFNNVGTSCVRNDKDRSVSCENRRNKVISNKINQKIMELTKNMSIVLPRPIVFHDDKPSENNAEHTQLVPESSIKTLHEQDIEIDTSTLPAQIKLMDNKEAKEKDFKTENEEKEPLTSAKANQKTPVISNDDLFFTNRRKLSIFSRPFHSILGFESDLLSDVKGSDDDFSIHELYFKKPYHRHESNSCTDHLNHEHMRMENPEQKRVSTLLGLYYTCRCP